MNLYFYASAASAAAVQFSGQLLTSDHLPPMTVLPAGSCLKSSHSLDLRSGDVMILFASTAKELEDLNSIHDKFDEFRVILILPECETQLIGLSHILKPRFISFIESGVTDLEKVIAKITTSHTISLYTADTDRIKTFDESSSH